MSPNDAVSMRGLDELASRISKVKVDLGEMELLATTIGATPYVGQVTALRGSVFDTESRINELNSRINELKWRFDKLSSRFDELKSRYNELSSLINGHSCAVRDDDTPSSEKKEQPANVSDLETAVRKMFKAGLTNPVSPDWISKLSEVQQPVAPLRDHRCKHIPDSPSSESDLFEFQQAEVNAIAQNVLGLNTDGGLDPKMRQFGIPKL